MRKYTLFFKYVCVVFPFFVNFAIKKSKSMKNLYRILVGLLVVLGLGGCSGNELEEDTSDKIQLKFQVINYEQIAMSNSSRTRASDSKPNLAMAIYDAQTNALVQDPTIHKYDSEDGGNFSARLRKGEYNIVFLSYPTEKALKAADPTAIQWDGQVVGITHLKKITVSVDENTKAQQEILLARAVGRFTLNSKGTPVPQNFDHFRIQMTGGSYQLNALTGLAGSERSRDYAFSSPKDDAAGKTEITQFAYAFLPQEECKVDITLIAEDKDNNPIHKRTFTQVPMKINQDTRYTGDFFNETSNNGFSLKLDEKPWEEVNYEF